MDVIIQKTTQGPLSLGCAEPALPEGEPRVLFRFVSTSAPIVPTMQNAVPHLIHRLWRSPFPEGEGYGRNTIQPHKLYSKRGGRQIAAPTDTLVGHRSSAQVVFETLLGDESSPLHCVVPFNRTGSIRNVPGVIPLRPSFVRCFVLSCPVGANPGRKLRKIYVKILQMFYMTVQTDFTWRWYPVTKRV